MSQGSDPSLDGARGLARAQGPREAAGRWHGARWAGEALLRAALLATLLASAVAWLAADWWVADLATHFRLQYLAVALLLAGVWAVLRRPAWLLLALATILLNAMPVFAWINAPVAAPARRAAAPAMLPVRVAAANLFWRSREYAAVREWARASGSDLLVFVEVTDRWARELEPLRERWPHMQLALKPGHSGTLVLSRWPLRAAGVVSTHARGTPDPIVEVAMPGRRWTLVPVHANWPMGRRASAYRAADLRGLASVSVQRKGPLLAIGDFNLSPLSPHFDTLLRDGRLYSAAAGRGWQPTWPVFLPVAGIQIDHALASPDIEVNSFRASAIKGSDHRPIIVDLGIPRQESAE